MAEEEKSAGSGFGKLVYGTLKGNGINTDNLSFEEAVKKFNELGGTDNWHAKIMRKEAEENKAKEEREQSAKEEKKETPALDEWYEEGEITTKERETIVRYANRFEEHPDNIIASMREYRNKGYSMQDALDESLDDLVGETGYFERKQEKEPTKPTVEDYTEQLQKLSKEQRVDMKYIQEDLQTRLDEGQNPEEALKEIENNLKNAKPESLKEKVDRRVKSFIENAKKGKIKAEGNAPKEFKWNDKTNSYEYGGASIMKSFAGDGLYEVDVAGEELIVSSLEDAKKKIDQMNAYEKKHNGYMYGQDKYM